MLTRLNVILSSDSRLRLSSLDGEKGLDQGEGVKQDWCVTARSGCARITTVARPGRPGSVWLWPACFMTTALKLAIVGGGPSAFFVASRLLQLLPSSIHGPGKVQIDIFDRLWAPHGLVRYGVAPDHPEVKVCTIVQIVEVCVIDMFHPIELYK